MENIKFILNTKLFKNGFWLFILQTFNTIIPLVTVPYITRVLGTTNYGLFSLALNWIIYFQVIVEYGFGFTGARKVSIQKDSSIQLLFSRIITARLLLLVISFALMNLLSYIAHVSTERYISMNILFLVIIGIAFQLTWLFQGKQDMKFITIVNAIARLVSILLVFLLVKQHSHLYLYCFCYSVTYIVSAFIGLALAHYKYGLKIHFCSIKDAISEIKDGWYLFISQAMARIIGAVGTTVIGEVATASAIGIYSAIYKLPQVMVLFFHPISQALYPYISVKFSDSFQDGEKIVKKAASFVLPVFLAGGLMICIFRVQIIRIAFGSAYLEYDSVIIPLIAWMILSITNNFLGVQFLVASGNQKVYSQAVTIGAVITIALNICLGILFQVYGVAIAAALGEFALTIVLIIKIHNIRSLLQN